MHLSDRPDAVFRTAPQGRARPRFRGTGGGGEPARIFRVDTGPDARRQRTAPARGEPGRVPSTAGSAGLSACYITR